MIVIIVKSGKKLGVDDATIEFFHTDQHGKVRLECVGMDFEILRNGKRKGPFDGTMFVGDTIRNKDVAIRLERVGWSNVRVAIEGREGLLVSRDVDNIAPYCKS